MSNQQTDEKQNHICSHRYAFSLNNIFRRLLQSPEKIVGPYIKENDTVIDIGCGPGFFTLPMANLVGENGKVIAVDLQPEMLKKIEKKLTTSPIKKRVTLHRCSENGLNLDEEVKADFILAFYMVHETPDLSLFFKEIKKHLKKGANCLVVEPPFHVTKKDFSKSKEIAESVGLTISLTPKRKGGLTMLLSH